MTSACTDCIPYISGAKDSPFLLLTNGLLIEFLDSFSDRGTVPLIDMAKRGRMISISIFKKIACGAYVCIFLILSAYSTLVNDIFHMHLLSKGHRDLCTQLHCSYFHLPAFLFLALVSCVLVSFLSIPRFVLLLLLLLSVVLVFQWLSSPICSLFLCSLVFPVLYLCELSFLFSLWM